MSVTRTTTASPTSTEVIGSAIPLPGGRLLVQGVDRRPQSGGVGKEKARKAAARAADVGKGGGKRKWDEAKAQAKAAKKATRRKPAK
ncbi:hypothetical protein [Streptomyces globisporus]